MNRLSICALLILIFGCLGTQHESIVPEVFNQTANQTMPAPSIVIQNTTATPEQEQNQTVLVQTQNHEFKILIPPVGLYNAQGMEGDSIILTNGTNALIIESGPKEHVPIVQTIINNITQVSYLSLIPYKPYWSGFEYIEERSNVTKIYLLDTNNSVFEPTYNEFRARLKHTYTTVMLEEKDIIEFDGATIRVERKGTPELESSAPILTITYGSTCILIPTKSNYNSELEIINRLNLSCPIHLASNHGLGYESNDMRTFFFVAKPKAVIITGGPDEDVAAQKGRGILYNVLNDLHIPQYKAFEKTVTIRFNQTTYEILQN